MWVIVPVKRFSVAKQRLSPIVSVAERAVLARTMAIRVLGELAKARTVRGVTVVSGDPDLRFMADRFGFDFLQDAEVGLNQALAETVAALDGANVLDMAIVHADLPFFTCQEFDRIADRHMSGPSLKMTIVPDAASEGTNLRFCRPGGVVPLLFGQGSARRHCAAAKRIGVFTEVVDSPTLSIDCDTPADLERIRAHPVRSTPDGLDTNMSMALPEIRRQCEGIFP